MRMSITIAAVVGIRVQGSTFFLEYGNMLEILEHQRWVLRHHE